MDKFNTIEDFVKCKETCVFCNTPLKVVVTNYVGVSGQGIPIINAPLKNDRFEFKIKHTTASFEVKADVFIFIQNNTLIFDNFNNFNSQTPSVDERLVKQVFEDYGPHFELYCPSKKCGLGYFLAGWPLKIKKNHPVEGMWYIEPFSMFTENVRVGSYVVANNWETKLSSIYSRKNIDAKPIVVPMVDFSTMNKEKLITRIKTLVTFS